jgi:hypothetical protein
MVSEKWNLWYCDTFVYTNWQFFFLLLPLVGAFLYGREKYRTAWTLIGIWVFVHLTFSALTNFVFDCSIE